ncbi:MAG TPA: hypothetical protein PLP29_08180 [Candidatus Ozemobacteraceae bacterium]|nr:hypothetical protein [Candidatus Ozemobacteraceae bacterium]
MKLRVLPALLAILLAVGPAVPAAARNPISSYLSRLLDESRAEIAIGQLLSEAFISELASSQMAASSPLAMPAPAADTASAAVAPADQEAIRLLVADLASRCPRPTMPYAVTIVESPIPTDIPFPGGPIIISSALWHQAASPAEREFLIARNLMHVALRQPMNAIKHEGLYARLLKLLKQRNRDPYEMREAVRDYMKVAERMDQIRADREGIMLSTSPALVRDGGIALLKRLTQMLWPFAFGAVDDLVARIRGLERLTLP